MKPIVIYHANCTDGFTAAWCFHHYGRDLFDFHPGVYGENPPDVTGRVVYLVDFSYKRPVLLGMAAVAERIIILDHHKSAKENLDGVAEEATVVGGDIDVWFDMEQSGAGMAWRHLFPGKSTPKWVQHVEDRDLWRFKLPCTREFHAFLASLDWNFDQFDHVHSLQSLAPCYEIGATLLRVHDGHVRDAINMTKRTLEIGGIRVPVANANYNLASDVGNKLAKGVPFAAVYYDSEQYRTFSLRSDKDDPMAADVSLIAKQYGGGGHANAAGFRVPRDHELARA